MELTQLKYFVTVAEELHFGNAARKLNMTQPPLSIQIKNLEEELGVRLFRRTNRSVSLTREGRLFLDDAKEILNRTENAVSNIKSLSESFRGPLRIGFNEPAINSFLPGLIKEFRKKNPAVLISLLELETGEQTEALAQYRLDIGFARLFKLDPPGIECMLMSSEKYLAALPPNHRLLKHETLEAPMLRNESLIIFPQRSQPLLYGEMLSILERNGYVPKLIQEAVTKQTTLALVEAGMGIAFVPESTAGLRRKGVEFRKINIPFPEINIYAIWRKNDRSPLLEKFMKELGLKS